MRPILVRSLPVQVIAALLFPAWPTISLAEPNRQFVLSSADFQNGGSIPERFSCDGGNQSPALAWTGIPDRTRSLALIVADPDAPGGIFVHWVVYNLSATTSGLAEGVPAASVDHAEQGVNGRGELGYAGPCPPPGKPHHYHFRLYALDQKLHLNPGATAAQVEQESKAHIVGSAELVGIFQR